MSDTFPPGTMSVGGGPLFITPSAMGTFDLGAYIEARATAIAQAMLSPTMMIGTTDANGLLTWSFPAGMWSKPPLVFGFPVNPTLQTVCWAISRSTTSAVLKSIRLTPVTITLSSLTAAGVGGLTLDPFPLAPGITILGIARADTT